MFPFARETRSDTTRKAATALPNNTTKSPSTPASFKERVNEFRRKVAAKLDPDTDWSVPQAEVPAPAAAPSTAELHNIRAAVATASTTAQRHRVDPRAPHWRDAKFPPGREIRSSHARGSTDPVENPDPVAQRFGESGHPVSAYTDDSKPHSTGPSTRRRRRSGDSDTCLSRRILGGRCHGSPSRTWTRTTCWKMRR